MTVEQKNSLSSLILKKNFNIFQSIDFITKKLDSNQSDFTLEYNAKSYLWVLRGKFINKITMNLEKENSIKASNLTLLQTKFINILNSYLK